MLKKSKFLIIIQLTALLLLSLVLISCQRGNTGGQAAIERYTSSSGIEMVKIPPGVFVMGDNNYADWGAAPEHRVRLTRGFYMGVYEVTQAQWKTVMGTDTVPCAFLGDNRPVEMVNWYEAIIFCNRLSIKEGLIPVYKLFGSFDPSTWGAVPDRSVANSPWNNIEIEEDANGYRLPTEAQWEYACRAGTTTPWSHDSSRHDDYMWYRDNSTDGTENVGRKLPNPWGLHDMHGSLWEWCWDWYGRYPSTAAPREDPMGPDSGSGRARRGGAWYFAASDATSVNRLEDHPGNRMSTTGFRVIRF